jgi:hypothetical protein
MYSCFWMLAHWPADYREIDIAEWQYFPNTVDVALHTGDWYTWKYVAGQDFTADFHTYAVNWQPDSVTYYIDGVQFFQVTVNVPQTPMWMIINSGNGTNVDLSSLPSSMVVQYVRVWQGSGTTPPVPPLPPPPSTGNLIQDPGFESQIGGLGFAAPWSDTGPTMIGVDPVNGMNGSKCGFICDGYGSGAWSDIRQTVAVSPHTNYTLSCWIQTDDTTFPAQGLMGVQTTGGTILASHSYGQMTNYTPLTVTFNSGSNSSVVVFTGFTDQGVGAWIHVDNWSMQ